MKDDEEDGEHDGDDINPLRAHRARVLDQMRRCAPCLTLFFRVRDSRELTQWSESVNRLVAAISRRRLRAVELASRIGAGGSISSAPTTAGLASLAWAGLVKVRKGHHAAAAGSGGNEGDTERDTVLEEMRNNRAAMKIVRMFQARRAAKAALEAQRIRALEDDDAQRKLDGGGDLSAIPPLRRTLRVAILGSAFSGKTSLCAWLVGVGAISDAAALKAKVRAACRKHREMQRRTTQDCGGVGGGGKAYHPDDHSALRKRHHHAARLARARANEQRLMSERLEDLGMMEHTMFTHFSRPYTTVMSVDAIVVQPQQSIGIEDDAVNLFSRTGRGERGQSIEADFMLELLDFHALDDEDDGDDDGDESDIAVLGDWLRRHHRAQPLSSSGLPSAFIVVAELSSEHSIQVASRVLHLLDEEVLLRTRPGSPTPLIIVLFSKVDGLSNGRIDVDNATALVELARTVSSHAGARVQIGATALGSVRWASSETMNESVEQMLRSMSDPARACSLDTLLRRVVVDACYVQRPASAYEYIDRIAEREMKAQLAVAYAQTQRRAFVKIQLSSTLAAALIQRTFRRWWSSSSADRREEARGERQYVQRLRKKRKMERETREKQRAAAIAVAAAAAEAEENVVGNRGWRRGGRKKPREKKKKLLAQAGDDAHSVQQQRRRRECVGCPLS